MNLGDIITTLEAANPDQVVHHGFHNPHSYRGDYYDLAFEPTQNITVADMLEAARSAVGATYQGYKGGDFKMTASDWCWLSEEGSASGETISPLLLDLMLRPEKEVPADIEQTEQLREVTPALSTDRIWQIQVQRRNGSWIDHSPATIHGSEAQADYEEAVATSGHLWSYRLVCSDRTHTIAAQHDRPEEA